MGLTEKDFDLAKVFKKLYVSNIGGFYDPRIQELNIVNLTKNPNMFQKAQERIAMVHELTHAIDDQYFDLLNNVHREKLNSDEQLAYMAVIEGTTGCVQYDYAMGGSSYNNQYIKNFP